MKINFIVVCIAIILQCAKTINFSSNFNKDKAKQAYIDDPVSLPIIVNSLLQRKYCQATATNFNMKKHQLRDSDYVPSIEKLDQIEERIIFQQEPPLEVFSVSRINIQDYQVLQIRDFGIVFINPTKAFRFCITEVFSDSETIKRIQHKKFPFCLNSYHKYPFFFRFYITEFKPKLFYKVVIYFFVDIYDKDTFVGNKIWPREIFVKVNQNFLRLAPLEAKNCGKNFTTLTISNHQAYHIKIAIDTDQGSTQKAIMRQVLVPSQKSFKMTIMPQQKTMIIIPRAFQLPDIRLPRLYMPILCLEPLQIDHYNIGVLNSERSISQIPLLVSSNSKDTIQILDISLESISQTTEVLAVQGKSQFIQPGDLHKIVGKLIFHLSNEPVQKNSITIKINYIQKQSPKDILQVKTVFQYHEFRNPLSFGSKRFINVRQKARQRLQQQQNAGNSLLKNLFTMRNNLNLPIQLTNIIYDSDIFKVTWLAELKQFIYPNHQRDEVLLEYVGPLEISISPLKFIISLQFNGKLYMPIQIIVYDETLQCVYNNIQQKCQNLPLIDYGYFRNNSTKFKQIVVRNWNPTPIELQIGLLDNVINNYGMNFTLSIYGPFPRYQITSKHDNNTLFYYLKGGHFIIVNFAITPQANATSGQSIFQLKTQHEQLNTKIKFKIQNATIALIPQILWINSAYQRSVQYLNLVSTFSEPYKIKSVSVNISNINIFSNNDTQIFQNQWIGLALIYQPFGKGNFTDSCCGSEFATNGFINSLYYLGQAKKFTYAMVRVSTTTQLETTSIIIIDNTPPQLIGSPNITLRLMKMKNSQPVSITLKNVFSQPMKFSIVLTPTYLYRDARQYMSIMRRIRKNYEDTMFCVNNGISISHNFSPQMVKNLFSLDSNPQQVTIQPLGNSEYYVGSERKSSLGTSNQLSKYVIDTVDEGARICYRMNASKYIKQLVQTKILNDLAQNHSNQLFLQFVQKQMEYYHVPFQFLEHDEFYDSISSIDFQKYCSTTFFPVFRFCKQINLHIKPAQNQQIVLKTNQQYKISIEKCMLPPKVISQQYAQFYLTILNNITRYQSHYVQISFNDPKIAIQGICTIPADTLNQYSTVNSIQYNNTCHGPTQLSQILQDKNNQLLNIVKKTNHQYQKSGSDPNLVKSSIIPIKIMSSQFINSTYRSSKYVTIKNNGLIDIQITHLGLNKNEGLCQNQVLTINNNICNQTFILRPNQQVNIDIQLNFDQSMTEQQYYLANIYLYHQDKYYYKIHLIVKFPDIRSEHSSHKMLYSLGLNLISMFFIILVILLKRKQNIQIQRKTNKNTKIRNKILGREYYHQLGYKIAKKKKKLDLIIDSHILSLKQYQENKLKDYFNSSGESEIERKNMVEEQSSNNNLLNSLKQPQRNSMVMSEQSSIDLMDLNHMNRSSDNATDQADKVGTEQQSDRSSSFQQQDQLFDEFDEGDEVLDQKTFIDFGWGNADQKTSEQSQKSSKQSDKDASHYNIFLSQNPLKKQQKDPFHWMQVNKSHLQW